MSWRWTEPDLVVEAGPSLSGVSARLAMVGHLAKTSSGVADVGADHAYLAVAMVKAGWARHGIAIDVVPDLIAQAGRYVARCGFTSRVAVRCGDGLEPLAPGDVDTVVVAGMGGRLAARLLAPERLSVLGVRRIVVQPNRDDVALRRHLYASGWSLQTEALVRDGGRLYYALAAAPAAGGPRGAPDPLDLWLGPHLRHQHGPLVHTFQRIRADWLRRKPPPHDPEVARVLAYLSTERA